MYNTEIVCTYHTDEVFLETDKITEKERNFVRDAIYRQEMLDILVMEDYNEAELLRSINELYKKVHACNGLKRCMLKLAKNYISDDPVFGLTLLFAFDYMHLTHICICEYLETGEINEKNMADLNELVFYEDF